MGNYEQLKQSVSDVIKTNGNQEITGSILQNVLLTIISSVGANATFAGIATPTTNPGTPDGPVFWLASEGGTYTNFNAIELQAGLSVLMWNGSWSSQQIFSVDDVPIAGSDNLVKSGGVYTKIKAIKDAGYVFAGVATPTTDPGTPDQNVFYIASEAGIYTNFGGAELQDGLSLLMWNGSWSSQQIFGVDNEPTAGSDNLVKSGGVQEELALGAVYDVSAKNPTAGVNNDGKWESLSALLSDANLNTLIPTSVRKGGMSIKFVQSSDNKYVQARCMAQNFTTDVTQWQSENVTDKPVYKGKDLVSSGGIYDAIPLEGYVHPKTDINLDIADPKGNVIVRFSKGNIKTLKFDSESTPAQIPENNDKELQISDPQGCVIAEFEGGDFKTKNFDSRYVALSEEEPSDDFGVADPQGFILLRCKNGGIRTQKFNSKAITDKIDIAPSSYLRDINEVISVNEDISCSSVEKFDLPFTDMTEKWVGGILAPNGKITCIPNSGTQIAEIDPATNQISLYGNLPQGKFKWSGGTLGSDGLIYCSPRSSNHILVINPETRKYELKDMSTTYNFNDHHYGGVVVGMKMYLAPNGSKDILVVDLIKGTTINIGDVDVSYSYCAILYHPNGYIYMFPYQMGKVIKINPQNDTWEYVGDALKVSCYGLAINPVDNCVYGFSAYVKGIYKFDPSTNTSSWLKTDEINFNENGGNWYGTVLGMNGKIYSMPGWCNWVYEYDIASDSLRLITTLPTDAGSATARTAGGVLSSDGTIWAVCAIKRYFYKFNFEGIKRTFPMNELSSVYFKNY